MRLFKCAFECTFELQLTWLRRIQREGLKDRKATMLRAEVPMKGGAWTIGKGNEARRIVLRNAAG